MKTKLYFTLTFAYTILFSSCVTSDEEIRMNAMIQGAWFLESTTIDEEYEEFEVEEELAYWEFKAQGVLIISIENDSGTVREVNYGTYQLNGEELDILIDNNQINWKIIELSATSLVLLKLDPQDDIDITYYFSLVERG